MAASNPSAFITMVDPSRIVLTLDADSLLSNEREWVMHNNDVMDVGMTYDTV